MESAQHLALLPRKRGLLPTDASHGNLKPRRVVKAALVYSLLDDTGIVYTDDYGDKYFMYPTNGITQKVIYPFVGLFGGQFDPLTQVEPFGLGARFWGLRHPPIP